MNIFMERLLGNAFKSFIVLFYFGFFSVKDMYSLTGWITTGKNASSHVQQEFCSKEFKSVLISVRDYVFIQN